jgi:hypothetical protein
VTLNRLTLCRFSSPRWFMFLFVSFVPLRYIAATRSL